MICKLCLQTREKLQRSHVIPEFLARPAYDGKYRMLTLAKNNRAGPILKGVVRQKGQRGLDVDERLTCRACDVDFSKWEGYVKRALYDRELIVEAGKITLPDSQESLSYDFVKNLNYYNTKLFVLSLIWRLSASKLSIAEGVVLGPHEERIRELLLAKDPDDDLIYPTWVSQIWLKDRPFTGVYAANIRYASMNAVMVFAGGFRFTMLVTKNEIPDSFQYVRIKANNTAIITSHQTRDIELLRNLAKRLPPEIRVDGQIRSRRSSLFGEYF